MSTWLEITYGQSEVIPKYENTIDENYMWSLSLEDKINPVNILNLGDTDIHNNEVYPQDFENIPVNERSEIVFESNQIMNKDKKAYIEPLFNAIQGLSYYPFESETYGAIHFEPLDYVNVTDLNGVKHPSIVMKNNLKFTSGIQEEMSAVLPMSLKDEYALVTDIQRDFMRVYFIVDQQNGIIEGLVKQVTEEAEKTAQLRIDVDKIETTVEAIDLLNIIPNPNKKDGNFGWTSTAELIATDDLVVSDFLTFYQASIPKKILGSLSEWGQEFTNIGEEISGFGYIADNTKDYSYKFKVNNPKGMRVNIYEYSQNIDSPEFPYGDKVYYDMNATNSTFGATYYDYIDTDVITIPNDTTELWVMPSNLENARYLGVRALEVFSYHGAGKTSIEVYQYKLDGVKINIPIGTTQIVISAQCYNNPPTGELMTGYVSVRNVNTQPDYLIRKQSFYESSSLTTIARTFQLTENTNYIKIGLEVSSRTFPYLETYDLMVNQGQPKDFVESPNDAYTYAKSSREQSANSIRDVVTEVDKVTGDIHNTTVDITAKDGVVIKNNNGKGLTILNDDGNPSIELTSFGHIRSIGMQAENMYATNATIYGKVSTGDLLATGGKIGDLFLIDGTLKGQGLELNGDLLKVGNIIMEKTKLFGGVNFSPSEQGSSTQVNMAFNNKTIIAKRTLSSGSNNYDMHYGSIDILEPTGMTPSSSTSIGSLTDRFYSAYFSTQPNVSSDIRLKENILPIDGDFIRIFGEVVKPKVYQQRGETHFGYLAQDVERALFKYVTSRKGVKSINQAKEHVERYALIAQSESHKSLLYGEIAVIIDAYNRLIQDDMNKRIEALEELLLKKGND